MSQRITVTLFVSAVYILGAGANYCYVCLTTSNPADCSSQYYCPAQNGCFSQTWLENGLLYYQKGCLPANTNCDSSERQFCTNYNAFHCCEGNTCNFFDPMENWVPWIPKGVTPLIGKTSVTLEWDPRCSNLYTYEIGYSLQQGTSSADPVVVIVTTNQVTIHSLDPASTYLVTVRSIYAGIYSRSAELLITTLPGVTTTTTAPSTSDASCWNTENTSTTTSFLEICGNLVDSCFSKIEYTNSNAFGVVTRGCMSKTQCENLPSQNDASCSPGTIGKHCQFCCDGLSCNSYNWTRTQLTCNEIPVNDRILCGWVGITEATCRSQGCCYKEEDNSAAWCHHAKYVKSEVVSSAALPFWVIIIIVVAILILLIIVAIIVYCCRREKESGKGFYDVYAVPNKNRNNQPRVTTTAREAYDNTVSEA